MKYKVGDNITWHNGNVETIRKIENGKIYISHLCGYTENELERLIIKEMLED